MADITLPQLGETVTEGTITRWFKKVGGVYAQNTTFQALLEDVNGITLPYWCDETGWYNNQAAVGAMTTEESQSFVNLEFAAECGNRVEHMCFYCLYNDSDPMGSGQHFEIRHGPDLTSGPWMSYTTLSEYFAG